MSLSPTTRGFLLALTATLIWSANFVLSKVLAASIPPITLNAIRWSTAVICLLPFCYKEFLAILPIIRQHLLLFLTISLTGIVFFNTFIYIAGHSTDAINMSLLACTSPIFTLILLWCFRLEKPSLRYVLALSISLVGVLLIITKGDLNVLWHLSFTAGDLWTLTAACCFAIYSILVRYTPKGVSAKAFLLAIFMLGTSFLIPASAVELAMGAEINWHFGLVGYLLYLGVAMSIFGYLCWNKALSLIGPSKTIMVYYTMPLLASIEAVFVLNETITILHFISAVCIIGGILLTSIKRGQKVTINELRKT